MPWWTEQIVIGTAAWTAVTAAVATALLMWRRKRAAKDDEIVDRALAREISLYDAAEFTDDSGTEVAVWLLLEGGHVHVARDGRIRPTVAAMTRDRTPIDDPAQAAVLDYLRRKPHGSKLHEILGDATCRELCESRPGLGTAVPELRTLRANRPRGWAMTAAYLIPIAAAVSAIVHAGNIEAGYRSEAVLYWTLATILAFIVLPTAASRLFRRSSRSPAQARLRLHCEGLVGGRFGSLGFEEERRSARIFRTRAPAYAPRRSRTSAGSSCAAFTPDSGASSCGSSSSSCGSSSSSCGGSSS